MIARYGLWFAAGFLLSLLHGWMIARSVHRYDPALRGTARLRAAWGAALRLLTSAGAMGLALVDGVWAGVAVAVGLVFGRWSFAITVASGKLGTLVR